MSEREGGGDDSKLDLDSECNVFRTTCRCVLTILFCISVMIHDYRLQNVVPNPPSCSYVVLSISVGARGARDPGGLELL